MFINFAKGFIKFHLFVYLPWCFALSARFLSLYRPAQHTVYLLQKKKKKKHLLIPSTTFYSFRMKVWSVNIFFYVFLFFKRKLEWWTHSHDFLLVPLMNLIKNSQISQDVYSSGDNCNLAVPHFTLYFYFEKILSNFLNGAFPVLTSFETSEYLKRK